MNQNEIQNYVGKKVALKDWYRILTEPGTPGQVTAMFSTLQGEVYISVKLQDKVASEEPFKLDAFHRMFRILDPMPGAQIY